MFTFLTISYNHEEFIIEHLESIKYQINRYGGGDEFKYILSDDCSKDNTVSLVEKWLSMNKGLFKETEILRSEKNQGIVKNYLKATNAIGPGKFKALAGDDLYYKNNILFFDNYDLVFTPVIEFFDNTFRINPLSIAFLIQNKETHRLKTLVNYANPFNAPGTFINDKLIKDKHLRSFISQYRWIEDYPTWYYIFNNNENINCIIGHDPYVIYRITSGISKSGAHTKNHDFIEEEKQMRKKLKVKIYRFPKMINPYLYYWKFLKLKLKIVDFRTNPEIRAFNQKIESGIKEASEYFHEIRSNAKNFYKQIEVN